MFSANCTAAAAFCWRALAWITCAWNTASCCSAAAFCAWAETTAAFALRASAIAWSLDWREAQPPATSDPERVGIRAGPRLFGLRLGDGGLRRLDGGLLLGHLALCGLDRRGRLGGARDGLGEPGAPVGGIQHDQRVAGVDALVVGDLDGGDVALDARAQHGDVALDVGVVGAFDVAALGEPPGGGDADGHDRRECRRRAP